MDWSQSMEKLLTDFWDWVDERMVVRRLMTIGTFLMTMWAIKWAMEFALSSPRPGADIAMIIGAVMVPVNSLLGYMFSVYTSGSATGKGV
jgi:hypothetical protein